MPARNCFSSPWVAINLNAICGCLYLVAERTLVPLPDRLFVTNPKAGPSYCFPMHDLYQERVLDSPEVCSNCYATVRIERDRATHGRFDRTLESSRYSRERRHTTIEYAPAESVSRCKGVFCICGVESSFHRVWDDRTVTHGRFRMFLKNVLRSLERQGIQINRLRAAYHAFCRFGERLDGAVYGPHESPPPSIDECLAIGVAYGLQAEQTPDSIISEAV